MTVLDVLDRLIAFPTVSRDSNRDIIDFIRQFLAQRGIGSDLFPGENGRKANLFATLGPTDKPGIILSGHTDVVPVDGQDWATDPFRMTLADGKAFGRGATDMKGFLACALLLADRAAPRRLTTPIHLAFSHDEEIGCVGVRSMIHDLARGAVRPRLAIVGEPTSMRVATGHKGKIAARATCCGSGGHSALAPRALNAIHLACDFVGAVRRQQDRIGRDGSRDDDYEVPCSTLHVGRIDGGVALNIVPDRCTVDFEIRNVAADDANAILHRLSGEAAEIAARLRDGFPQADIRIDVLNAYPGLATPADSEAVCFVLGLVDSPQTTKVAFGTEGGLYSEQLGIPVVICGPGSMDQGHVANEFISLDQLEACGRMMDRLLARCS